MKEENEKADLKLNIQKMKIMTSDPITSWQIDGEKVEAVTEFIWYNCSAVCRLSARQPYGGINGNLSKRAYRIKTARRNINNLRYTDDTTFIAESKEELKSLLMKVKEENEKADLKLNI